MSGSRTGSRSIRLQFGHAGTRGRHLLLSVSHLKTTPGFNSATREPAGDTSLMGPASGEATRRIKSATREPAGDTRRLLVNASGVARRHSPPLQFGHAGTRGRHIIACSNTSGLASGFNSATREPAGDTSICQRGSLTVSELLQFGHAGTRGRHSPRRIRRPCSHPASIRPRGNPRETLQNIHEDASWDSASIRPRGNPRETQQMSLLSTQTMPFASIRPRGNPRETPLATRILVLQVLR